MSTIKEFLENVKYRIVTYYYVLMFNITKNPDYVINPKLYKSSVWLEGENLVVIHALKDKYFWIVERDNLLLKRIESIEQLSQEIDKLDYLGCLNP